MSFHEVGDDDMLYQLYSYKLVRSGVLQRMRWYVAQRPPNLAFDTYPSWTAERPYLRYQEPRLPRLGQYFSAEEAQATLAYLQTTSEFALSEIIRVGQERQIDYRLLGPEHPFYSPPYFLDEDPRCRLRFRVAGVFDAYLQLAPETPAGTEAQARTLIQQWAVDDHTWDLEKKGIHLDVRQPYELHWNPLVHVSGRAFPWLWDQVPLLPLATHVRDRVAAEVRYELEDSRWPPAPLDLSWLLPGCIDQWGDGDDEADDYRNSFVMYARLRCREAWTPRGAQIIEGVLWMRMVEELGYLTFFESSGSLHLTLYPPRPRYSLQSPSAAAYE